MIETQAVVVASVIGIGATFLMDIWNLLLKRVFGIPSLSYCLVGRWLCHMPAGVFRHENIASAPPKKFECATGWVVHYATGIIFSVVFIVLLKEGWLARPSFLPALLFGVCTAVFPFFVMQPSFGLGVAASKTPRPAKARLKSLATHSVFGAGLYVCALGVRWVWR